MPEGVLLVLPVKEERRSCHFCRHARHGTTTICTLVAESIHDEIAVARECPDYEQETP